MGNCFSCEEKQILKIEQKNKIISHEYGKLLQNLER